MTMTLQTIPIEEYLTRKDIAFRKNGNELIAGCIFNGCDDDSRSNEAHLYFNAETGQYDCKKCGETGNIVTLAKHLGDNVQDIALKPKKSKKKQTSSKQLDIAQVHKCHAALPDRIREYLYGRGISNDIIDSHQLGWGKFYGKNWITIPIEDETGEYSFFKLRQDPDVGDNKVTFPKGIKAQVYGWELLKEEQETIVICEGELDRLTLLSRNIPAITSTHGAGTFKDKWCESIGEGRKFYICFDNDSTGRTESKKVAKKIHDVGNKVFIITLPDDVGDKGDITDYFTKVKGNSDDLFEKYAKDFPEKIDTSQFKPMKPSELIDVLGLTIKQDTINKVVTFLCELSIYTESCQFNISYNAPSSTGKSFIPTEIGQLFPQEDLVEVAYCSPTAFFHDQGETDEEVKGQVIVDLSKKILIFLDQPHNQLLERLRPLLSHDKKEIQIKITDKSQKQGLRTKNVILRGYPAVIFCTAGLSIDEQEATRFLLLSPEVNQEKLREGILATIKRSSDKGKYDEWLEANPERKLLKQRILAIKQEDIVDINIKNEEKIKEKFLGSKKMLKPRHQRDIKRLLSIIKVLALLNCWWRDRDGSTLEANDDDINEGFDLWDEISVSQELNLPPYIYKLFNEVILALWEEKVAAQKAFGLPEKDTKGLDRKEILKKHYDVYGRFVDVTQLRQQILPMLETAGLITQENDKDDKRRRLVYPASSPYSIERNSETEGGVKQSDEEILKDLGL